MKSRDKKVQMWVDPIFKSELKVSAARNNMNVISLTRKLAIDKKLLLEEDKDNETPIRY